VLFIGNSHTSVNDLPKTFAALVRSGGGAVETAMIDELMRPLTRLRSPARTAWKFASVRLAGDKSGGVEVSAVCGRRLEMTAHRIGPSVQAVKITSPKTTAPLDTKRRARRFAADLGVGLEALRVATGAREGALTCRPAARPTSDGTCAGR